MWEMIVKAAHFAAEVALGIFVILGLVCSGCFLSGLLYYRNHRDLPEYHVQAEEHEGLTWWNAWRWSVPDRYRLLGDNVLVEALVFGFASVLALVWVLDLLFK
jgi:hypothetical protein